MHKTGNVNSNDKVDAIREGINEATKIFLEYLYEKEIDIKYIGLTVEYKDGFDYLKSETKAN